MSVTIFLLQMNRRTLHVLNRELSLECITALCVCEVGLIGINGYMRLSVLSVILTRWEETTLHFNFFKQSTRWESYQNTCLSEINLMSGLSVQQDVWTLTTWYLLGIPRYSLGYVMQSVVLCGIDANQIKNIYANFSFV